MAATTLFVHDVLMPDLAAIVLGYFRSPTRKPDDIAEAGEYETCVLETDTMAYMRGACQGNHLALIELMLARGATWCYVCRKTAGEHMTRAS